jgi:hypothetical protein
MRHLPNLSKLLLATACAWALPLAAHGAVSLGLNFAATDPDAAGSTLNATDVAGVVPAANWNNLTGATGSAPSGLKYDNSGVATASSASVTWSSPNTWRSTTGNNAFPAGPNRVLTNGYLDTNDTAAGGVTINVTGIDAAVRASRYDVYVYFVSDSNADRGGGYTINDGSGPVTKFGSTLGSPTAHVEDPGTDMDNSLDGTYLRFSGLTGASFTLTSDATLTTPPAGGNGFRAPINAVHIVQAIPEPSSVALALGGASLLGLLRRRRRVR